MNNKSLLRRLLKQLGNRNNKMGISLSAIVIILVLFFAPDLLNFDSSNTVIDNQDAEVISSEFSIQETILIKKLYSGSKKLTATFIGQLLRDKHDIKWAEGTAEYAGKKLNSWANWYESLKV